MKRIHGSTLRQLHDCILPARYIRKVTVALDPAYRKMVEEAKEVNAALGTLEVIYLVDPAAPQCRIVAVEYDDADAGGSADLYYYSYAEFAVQAFAHADRPILPLLPGETYLTLPEWLSPDASAGTDEAAEADDEAAEADDDVPTRTSGVNAPKGAGVLKICTTCNTHDKWERSCFSALDQQQDPATGMWHDVTDYPETTCVYTCGGCDEVYEVDEYELLETVRGALVDA